MVLQTTGAISLTDVQTEFGGTAPTAITEYFRGGSNVPDTAANSSIPTSGEVSLTDFYGGDSTTGGGGGGTLEFNFDYYAYGSDINELTVYWYNETTSTLNTIQTITGDIQTDNDPDTGDPWSAYNIDLSSYSGETGRIVIRYSTGGGFNQDPALDSMELVGTSSGTIDLDPNTTQSANTAWEQQGGSSSTYPTSGYSALTSNQNDAGDYWQYNTGTTPSGSTGPTEDSDGSGSGYYIYFEGSSPNNQSGIYGWLRTASTYTLGSGGGGGGITHIKSEGFNGTSSYSLTGIQSGDLVIVAAASDSTTPTAPTGFTQESNGGTSPGYMWSWDISSGTSMTISNLNTSTGSNLVNYIAMVFRGVDTTTPISNSATNNSSGSGSISCPSVSVSSGEMVVILGMLDDDNVADTSSLSAPSGYTLGTAQDSGTDGNDQSGSTVMGAYQLMSASGTESPGSFTFNNGNDNWRSFSIALAASGGGGGGGGGGGTGLSSALMTQLVGGTGNTNWTQYTISLSSYASNTIRLVWKYIVVNNGNVYQNDIQLDTVAITGGSESYNFDSDNESFQTTYVSDNPSTADSGYSSLTWYSVQTSDTRGYWCRDGNGSTPSGSTGGASAQGGSFYIYAETSSPTADGDAMWLRSPQITLDSTPGNCTFYVARDITGNSTLDFYVDVI